MAQFINPSASNMFGNEESVTCDTGMVFKDQYQCCSPLIALFVQIFTHNVIVEHSEHTRDERAREILNAIIQHWMEKIDWKEK